jgi:hypothetical protein
MKLLAVILTSALCATVVSAQTPPLLEAKKLPPEPSTLRNPASLSGAGAANFKQATDAEFIYGEPPKAKNDLVLMIGPPQRRHFEYLSAEEEAAMWQFRLKKRQEAAQKIALESSAKEEPAMPTSAAPIRKTKSSAAKFKWPRVVLKHNSICVPVLAKSEAADWRNHLTCWSSRK